MAPGCGGGAPSDEAPARKPVAGAPLCHRLQARVTGHVSTPAATELSGLASSHSRQGVLWTHNDSGDSARVFAVAPDGKLLGEFAVRGAENLDWEDIATGPRDDLYIADIGDNVAARSDVVVYRVPEPSLSGEGPSETAAAESLELRYPDHAHDAEALLVDPSSGALVIVTKNPAGSADVYLAGHPGAGATTTLRRAGRVRLGNALAVTAGDVSGNGRTIVLRTYDRAFVWSRGRGESLPSALRRPACTARADLLSEGQGEALALSRDGRAFYTVPEGRHPALRRYEP